MRNRFLTAWFLAITIITILNSCDKRGGGGCALSRSVYSSGTFMTLSLIDKDSNNLLTKKEVLARDIEVKYGNLSVDTMLLYHGDDSTSLKYVSFWKFGDTGENSLTVTVKGISHVVSFTNKLVWGGCAGPKFDLSNFKVDGKAIEPVFVSEPLYILGTKRMLNFPKLYIVI